MCASLPSMWTLLGSYSEHVDIIRLILRSIWTLLGSYSEYLDIIRLILASISRVSASSRATIITFNQRVSFAVVQTAIVCGQPDANKFHQLPLVENPSAQRFQTRKRKRADAQSRRSYQGSISPVTISPCFRFFKRRAACSESVVEELFSTDL